MATKVSAKVSNNAKSSANAKANAKAETKKEAVKLVQVPSQVLAQIETTAGASHAAEVAATAKEQTIVKLGSLVGNTMGKNPREVTKASIAAPFAKAFRLVNEKLGKAHPRYKDEKALGLYIGQQLSRVISIAYPGGASATPQEAKQAQANLAKAIASNEKQDTLYKVASGSMGYKGGKLVTIKAQPRGGANKKKPLDAFRDALKAAFSAAKSARLSKQQMAVGIHDVGVTDLEIWDDADDLKECIG